MKKNKKMNFEDYDNEDSGYAKSLREQNQRRPVKNWTKAYVEHAEEYDELEVFHKF